MMNIMDNGLWNIIVKATIGQLIINSEKITDNMWNIKWQGVCLHFYFFSEKFKSKYLRVSRTDGQ